MGKLIDYEHFNEARRNKGGRKYSRPFVHGNANRFIDRDSLPSSVISKREGMPMKYSERFKYIIVKIANKNNALAKELLQLPELTGETFQYSYLDMEGGESLSYLHLTDKGIADEDKYKSPKRQISKVYKVVKSIFGSKYTKTDVSKFISMYKTAYNQGPDKSEIPRGPQTQKQLIDKLTQDTKNDKIKWVKYESVNDFIKYNAIFKITDYKSMSFDFLQFLDKYEKNSLITVNLINKKGKTESEKRKYLDTITYSYLENSLKIFFEKYGKEVR